MRLLIQRVSEAKVLVEEKIVGSIGKGALVFVGICKGDGVAQAKWLAHKLLHLRFFSGEDGKMDLSVLDTQREVLIVSQFTLYGNCTQGRRPDFFDAEVPEKAEPLYEEFVREMRRSVPKVDTGIFGAYMQVHLVNDGPATFLLDSPSEKK